jgi:signal transduction histidine kinase
MDRPTLWERIRGVNPYVWDGLLAGLAFALAAFPLGPGSSSPEPGVPTDRAPDVLAWFLVIAGCAPLVFRRRAPMVVLGVVAAAAVAFAARGYAENLGPSLAIAAYTVAAYLPRRPVVTVGLPIAAVAAIAVSIRESSHALSIRGSSEVNWVEILVGLTFAVAIPMLLGRIAFNRRRRLERDRERAARDAVVEERARIARELHDAVSYSIGVMVVQADAPRTALDRDPAAAKVAIARVEDTGRSGLAEMRRLIGVLTEDGDGAALAPQPSLDQLDELLEGVRAAGLPVELVREGAARPIPAGLDLAAYRVIQEALTNVLKHAGRAHARVVLRYEGGEALVVEVADDGNGPLPTQTVGHGLIGMRERAALFGGSFVTQPRPGGGFEVRVRFPLEAGAAP